MLISEENDSESSSRPSTVIIVTVVIVLLILLLVGVAIIVWRYRRSYIGMLDLIFMTFLYISCHIHVGDIQNILRCNDDDDNKFLISVSNV